MTRINHQNTDWKKTEIDIKWRNRKKLTDGRNAGTAPFGTLSFKDLAYKWEWNESVFPDGKKHSM